MPVATQLVTVAEFLELPNPRNGFRQELRAGEVVEMPPPVLRHKIIQENVRDLLKSAKPTGSFAGTEVPFRASPEHEVRSADVAWISATRWRGKNVDEYLFGAPDLVIEVLSKSNTRSEMRERQALCLASGTLEFWVIDAKRLRVTVSRKDDLTQTYYSGDQIPLTLLNAQPIQVDQIFTGLD